MYWIINREDGTAHVHCAMSNRIAVLDEQDALRLNYCLHALDELLTHPDYEGGADTIREHGQFLLRIAYEHWTKRHD